MPLASSADSDHAALASRSSASGAGASVVAFDVSVLLNVDEEPDCLRGWLSRFSPNLPPERADSAARESDATAPAPSVVGFV